jgi:phospholipid/cholesterol/gamma-HCH transport system substrate-binding protein
MERNANYALVGFISLGLFVGLLVFVVWLARISFSDTYSTYQVVFMGPISGLSDGGEVHFNGIKVGDVTKIGLDDQDPRKVVAVVRVTSNVPIRTDSYATLEPLGITGVTYIQITAGTNGNKLLKAVTPPGQVPIITSKASALSGLLEGGGTVLNAAVDSLNRVNRILSDDNIKSFGSTLNNIQDVTAELRKRKELIADADQSLKDIDQTALSIKKLSDSSTELVNTDGKHTLKEASDAAEQIKAAATDARTLVNRLQGPTADFATNGLPQLTAAVASLQKAADSLNRLAIDAQESPQTLLTKPQPREVEVKP